MGWVPAIEMSFLSENDDELLYKSLDSPMKTAGAVNINDLHEHLGHPNFDITRATAKKYGIKVTGTPTVCTACQLSKAKRKNLNKG